MSVNQFENIRKCLHFNDNTNTTSRDEDGHDRLVKIRPIIELLRDRFTSVPVEESVSVDEHMCSTKARSYLKHGISGYAYNFEVFTGDENRVDNRNVSEEDPGACGNVVVRLNRVGPRHMNHKLYFRRNRFPDCKYPPEEELKKLLRGTSLEHTACIEGADLLNVVWKDNKTVMLLSTLAGQMPMQDVSRSDKTSRSRLPVACPKLIQLYNPHMRGVDLLDSTIDMGIVNAWILYRIVEAAKGNSKTLKLADFSMEIAHCLRSSGSNSVRCGRPSNDLEVQSQAEKSKGPTVHMPP
ncbi:hypothetical protein PR048_018036 [Dryococelus australis]|uniref:PiggyBac transposable element-derived protein domain-containing protein n=1 Tax=Dryococelus australis TaxID=614101 RepID=A0ABQ9HBA5_9NEOP|nr:hypothetical protein PR048_018036 [Dryococelus australis]